MNDIDLSSYSNWDPIGNVDTGEGFTGVLDGNGYSIKNLTINNSNPNEVLLGLFACIGTSDEASNPDTAPRTEIKDLSIINANINSCAINGESSVGILSAVARKYVDISNCSVSGEINVSSSYVGGLLGVTAGSEYSFSSISKCYSSANIRNNNSDINSSSGGITGYLMHYVINNSYFNGSVSGDSYAGGITGLSYSGGTMNCYATGSVSGNYAGGIAGILAGYDYNSIWNIQTTGQSTATNDDSLAQLYNTQGLTTAEMQDPSNWSGWDDSVWDFSTYPPKLKWQTQNDNPSDIPKNAIRLQIGADSTGTSVIYVDTSFDIGTFDVDFSSADSCAAAIEDIDEVLSRINTKRSEFGAVINRLSSILESQTTTIQNFTSAKSTIMDADIANESADFVKNQILQQTSSALLAQSQNLHASIVLSLIG